MIRFTKLFTLIALLIAPWIVSAGEEGEDFPGLRALMSENEYRAAGLDKLSPQELNALEAWFIRYQGGDPIQTVDPLEGTGAAAVGSSVEVSSAAESTGDADLVRARILPPFNGWSGKTLFRLDNGQVWKQRLKGRFDYAGDDTEVEIDRNFVGFYWLTHTATGRSVGVSRIE